MAHALGSCQNHTHFGPQVTPSGTSPQENKIRKEIPQQENQRLLLASTALQKWALVTQENVASPQDYKPSYPHYWSADSRDALFGAHLSSLSSHLIGFLCAIPTITTMPCISAIGMLSIQPSSARQLPPACSYLVKLEGIHDH